MKYIIVVNPDYIRDVQIADTKELSYDEIHEDIFNSDSMYRWLDIDAEHFIGAAEADSKDTAIEMAAKIKGYDKRILLAYPLENTML